jgi:type VI secretion system secreted protein VgrG
VAGSSLLRVTVGGGLPNDKLLVRAMEVRQNLGEHNICSVDFNTADFVKPSLNSLFGQDLAIAVETDGKSVEIFNGFVTGAGQEQQLYGGWALSIEGASQSLKLDGSRRERYYYKKILSEIAKELQGFNGIPIDVKTDGKRLNYVQFGESDFEFLSRLADDCGACIVPTQQGIEIRKGFHPAAQLAWHDNLFFAKASGRIGCTSVQGAFFDAAVGSGNRFPAQRENVAGSGDHGRILDAAISTSKTKLSSQNDVQAISTRTQLGNYQDMLKAESRRRAGNLVFIETHSRNPMIAPGAMAVISGMPQGEGNGSYGIVRATHRYLAAEGYSNIAILTPWLDYVGPEKPRRNFHNGVVTAIVTDNNDPDKRGRIKLRFHWQEDTTSWVRMATAHAGGKRGTLFWPEIGDEVVVAFEDGDPERPIVIGSIWNEHDQALRTPYRQAGDIDQNEVKRIVTRSGNAISIIDTAGKEVIELSTPNNKCWIQLSNDKAAPNPKSAPGPDITTSNVPRITLHSEGNIVLDAPNGDVSIHCKNLNYKVLENATGTVGKNDTLKVLGNREISVQQKQKLDAQSIETSALTNIKVNAGATIDEGASAQIKMQAPLIMLNP